MPEAARFPGPPRPPARDYAEVTEVRARRPQAVAEAARRRRRRPLLGPDGRLMIIAADHPARGALGVRDRPMAMGSRRELLDRLRAALARPGVDGFLGTPDLVEDLLLLGALEGKVVLGSMNRGGLQGAAFELDDRFTGYDAPSLAAAGLEGGKLLARIALDDAGSLATLTAAADAVSALAERGLMAMVEPFWSRREGSRVRNDLDPDSVIRSVAVAQGLGRTSAHTWLKLPVVEEMERVMDATTLPTLLLGGDPTSSPEEVFASWRTALALPAVRGLVVGRTLLYPADDDVEAAVDTAVSLVRPAPATR
ncbi:DhnA family fructose-bisphosphate aldolase class Ia [Kineococcus xinjiangensis]|uniref:DhnA family fructose-bisphosphate aldolase class Ia n=1 Tax=Kineococcus xinjiangensis TaxID=512762 RepID=A0A2S6IUG6_9ACTN|nr:deoxyribose-phosphate aldolase [Kineococcus xinjiangensis]PPK97876.1 DhnA family fructose-bisphosphate aldolase class Ia [Kineococcus xinjiangensis]